MKSQNLHLNPQLREIAAGHFMLLQSQNAKKKRDTLQLNLSGYSDVMHLIADIVKVSILALETEDYSGTAHIPEPHTNISGVLGIILDLIPYEEADLLDLLRQSVLSPIHDEMIIQEFMLLPPSTLFENSVN